MAKGQNKNPQSFQARAPGWCPGSRKGDRVNRCNMESGHSSVKRNPNHQLIIVGSDPMVISKAGLMALSEFSKFVQDLIWDGKARLEDKMWYMLGLQPQNTEMALVQGTMAKKNRRNDKLKKEKQAKKNKRAAVQQRKAITGTIECVTQRGWSLVNSTAKLVNLVADRS